MENIADIEGNSAHTETGNILEKGTVGTVINCNNVLSVHNVDEDDDDFDVCNNNSHYFYENTEQSTDVQDVESAYMGESFYSDESCNESDVEKLPFGSTESLTLIIDGEEDVKIENTEDETQLENTDDNETIYSLEDDITQATSNTKSILRHAGIRRKNLTFTDEQLRRIERENELLLRKIMLQQKPRDKIIRENVPRPRASSSAINRKKLQKKIEEDNMVHTLMNPQCITTAKDTTSKVLCNDEFDKKWI